MAAASIFVFVFIFLIWKRISPGPYEQIEALMEAGKWEEAAKKSHSLLKEDSGANLRLLMLGSVINFALAETSGGLTGETPFYEYEKKLYAHDQSSIFIAQVYMSKFRYFPASFSFSEMFCQYVERFGERPLQGEEVEVIKKGLSLSNFEETAGRDCKARLIASPMGRPFLATNTATRVNVRTLPNLDSAIAGKLQLGDRVVVLEKGPPQEINASKGFWYRIASPEVDGWAFGAFLEFPEQAMQEVE